MANVIKLITIEINNMTMIEIINTPAMVVDRATVILMETLLLPSKASKLKGIVSIIIRWTRRQRMYPSIFPAMVSAE